MINLDTYLMGRGPVAPDLEQNARELIRRVNVLLSMYAADREGSGYPVPRVVSGYRSPRINAQTPGAAPNSLHVTCEAVDLSDEPHDDGQALGLRPFARWCVLNETRVLAALDLAMEDPRATTGRTPWVHLQSRMPRSGRRIYIPSADWAGQLSGQPLTIARIV